MKVNLADEISKVEANSDVAPTTLTALKERRMLFCKGMLSLQEENSELIQKLETEQKSVFGSTATSASGIWTLF
jgi:hypothetical protein